MKKVIKQFIIFSTVGFLNTCIDFVVYLLLTRVFGVYLLIASTLSFLVASTNSYLLNKTFTFLDKNKHTLKSYSSFIFFNLVTLGVVTLVMYVGVKVLLLPDIQVKIFATLLSGAMNFSFNKFIVFSKKI